MEHASLSPDRKGTILSLPSAITLCCSGGWPRERNCNSSARYPTATCLLFTGRQPVLVLPSVHCTCYGKWINVSELLGLVVLEAMASGTPVVCSRIGGLPEVVQHGVTGYLVRPGDTGELRERLSQLLCDRALAVRLGAMRGAGSGANSPGKHVLIDA